MPILSPRERAGAETVFSVHPGFRSELERALLHFHWDVLQNTRNFGFLDEMRWSKLTKGQRRGKL